MAYGGMAKNLFDGGNVTFEDPSIAADLYAYKPPWMEEIKKVDRHTDRAGGVSFVSPVVHTLSSQFFRKHFEFFSVLLMDPQHLGNIIKITSEKASCVLRKHGIGNSMREKAWTILILSHV